MDEDSSRYASASNSPSITTITTLELKHDRSSKTNSFRRRKHSKCRRRRSKSRKTVLSDRSAKSSSTTKKRKYEISRKRKYMSSESDSTNLQKRMRENKNGIEDYLRTASAHKISKRKKSKKRHKAEIAPPLATPSVEMKQVVARRYEVWHEKFLTYQEIINYIKKLQQEYKDKISLHHLCWTREKKALYMVKIRSEKIRTLSAVMIDAGSNASELMTVSAAIFLIDFLVKNDMILLMEYIIVPCLNPDAYDAILNKRRKNQTKIQTPVDLSKRFPRELPELLCPFLPTKPIFAENNCYYLLKTIQQHKQNIVLYISLQSSDNAITYPLNNFFRDVYIYANSTKEAMKKNLEIRPIVPEPESNYCSVVEHIGYNYSKTIRFAYNINIYEQNAKPNPRRILEVGQECLRGVATLAKRVYKNYVKQKLDRTYFDTTVNPVTNN